MWQAVLFFQDFHQLKISDLKTIIYYPALHFRFSHCIAKSIFCMGIAMRVDICSINKISLAINAHSKITSFTSKFKLAFATSCLHYLYFFIGIRCRYFWITFLTKGSADKEQTNIELKKDLIYIL